MGVLAYAAAMGAERLASQSTSLMANVGCLGAVALIVVGLYQFSPLKHHCLEKCRSPLAFIMASWRDGYGVAFRMGLEHGVYCLGCCWLLFVILFPLCMLNVAAMATITLLIFAEKSLPPGHQTAQLGAVVLITYGLLAAFMPEHLATIMQVQDAMGIW